MIGLGSHVLAGCLLNRHVELEENVFLNIGVCVAHDTRIGRHSFLAPRVAVAGFCDIGPRNVLGINSTVIDNVAIAEGNLVGAGSTVISSIETSHGVWVGTPAERKKDASAAAPGRYAGRMAPRR